MNNPNYSNSHKNRQTFNYQGFTYLKGNCPICNGGRKDCRQSGKVIHCREDANPYGYKFLGESSIGFGMWIASSDADAQNEASREEWRRERERERSIKLAEEAKRYAESLSEAERDVEYRKVLSQLSLSDKHRADLKRRGLSDAQIDAGLYRSIGRFQKLEAKVNNRLAGIDIDGDGFTFGGTGYLCPIWNPEGLILGFQIKFDGGKYAWITSRVKNRPNGSSPHLQNGELPITYCSPNFNCHSLTLGKTLGFAEGTLKPKVASDLSGQDFIGASGGNWVSSPKQLEAYIEASEADKFVLYPDAGSHRNKQVQKQYKALHDLLADWGYQLDVAWWGQVSKDDDCDIDELLAEGIANEIKIISWEEYSKNCYRLTKIEEDWEAWEKQRQFTPSHTINQQWFSFRTAEINEALFIKSGLGTGKSENLKQAVLEHEYEKWLLMGYRNHLLQQTIARLNTVLEFGAGFHHLNNIDGNGDALLWRDSDNYKLACCVDSLFKFKPENFDDVNLIIDEYMSVVIHLLFSSTLSGESGRKRKIAMSQFIEAVRRAKRIYCLDGLMADWGVELIQRIRPDIKITKIENLYKGNPLDIEFFLGCTDLNNEENLKARDASGLRAIIMESKEPIAIFTDSQKEAEAWDGILTEFGFNTLRVDSKTSGEERIKKEFLNNPDKYLAELAETENKIDILICTPSCESGVDISIKGYFKDAYYLFFGVIAVNGILQMTGRVRDENCRRHIWISPTGIGDADLFTSTLDESLLAQYYRQYEEELGRHYCRGDSAELIEVTRQEFVRKLEYARVNNPFYQSYLRAKCQDNFERSHLRECLLKMLKQHNVEQTIGKHSEDAKQGMKSAKEEIEITDSHTICNAELVSPEQAERITSNWGASWEERCKATKTKLFIRLPGIGDEKDSEGKDIWTPDYVRRIRFKDRGFINKCETYYNLHHLEERKELEVRRWNKILRDGYIPSPRDMKSPSLKAFLLWYVGLADLLAPENLGKEYTAESDEILSIWERSEIRGVEVGLGVKRGVSPIKCVNNLLGLIGSSLKERKSNGARYYSIDQSELNDPMRLATLRCIERRDTEQLVNLREADALAKVRLEVDTAIAEEEASGDGEEENKKDAAGGVATGHIPPNLYINRHYVPCNEGKNGGVEDSSSDTTEGGGEALAHFTITADLWEETPFD